MRARYHRRPYGTDAPLTGRRFDGAVEVVEGEDLNVRDRIAFRTDARCATVPGASTNHSQQGGHRERLAMALAITSP